MPALRAAKGTASEFLGAGQGEGLTLFSCSRSEGVGRGALLGGWGRGGGSHEGWPAGDWLTGVAHSPTHRGPHRKRTCPEGRQTDGQAEGGGWPGLVPLTPSATARRSFWPPAGRTGLHATEVTAPGRWDPSKTPLPRPLGSSDPCSARKAPSARSQRREEAAIGRAGRGRRARLSPAPTASPSPASSGRLETPPHPSLPRPLPGLAGRVPLLAEVTSCLSRSRPHSAHLFICSFVCELECGFLGSCGAPGSGPGSPKDAGPMSLSSAETLWVVGKTGVQTNRYR